MQAQSARQYDPELLNKLALSQLAAEELIKREIKCPVCGFYLMDVYGRDHHKVLGRIANSAEGLILVFDLEEAIMFDALPEEYVDRRTGELKKRIKVYYPEKYEGRIGNYYHDYVATEQISMFENLNEYEDGQNGEGQTAPPPAAEATAATQNSLYQRPEPMPGGALNE